MHEGLARAPSYEETESLPNMYTAEELAFPKLDGILFPLVVENAEVVAPCRWMGGAEVTLTEALNNYYQVMTEENADEVIADVHEFLAGSQTPKDEEGEKKPEPYELQVARELGDKEPAPEDDAELPARQAKVVVLPPEPRPEKVEDTKERPVTHVSAETQTPQKAEPVEEDEATAAMEEGVASSAGAMPKAMLKPEIVPTVPDIPPELKTPEAPAIVSVPAQSAEHSQEMYADVSPLPAASSTQQEVPPVNLPYEEMAELPDEADAGEGQDHVNQPAEMPADIPIAPEELLPLEPIGPTLPDTEASRLQAVERGGDLGPCREDNVASAPDMPESSLPSHYEDEELPPAEPTGTEQLARAHAAFQEMEESLTHLVLRMEADGAVSSDAMPGQTIETVNLGTDEDGAAYQQEVEALLTNLFDNVAVQQPELRAHIARAVIERQEATCGDEEEEVMNGTSYRRAKGALATVSAVKKTLSKALAIGRSALRFVVVAVATNSS